LQHKLKPPEGEGSGEPIGKKKKGVTEIETLNFPQGTGKRGRADGLGKVKRIKTGGAKGREKKLLVSKGVFRKPSNGDLFLTGSGRSWLCQGGGGKVGHEIQNKGQKETGSWGGGMERGRGKKCFKENRERTWESNVKLG